MLTIVSASEVAEDLGETAPERRPLLVALAECVESVFYGALGRAGRPYLRTPQAGRTEVHDGTGSPTLYVDYPVGALTSLKLGYDAADPDETLDVTKPKELRWMTGQRRVTRVSCLYSTGAWSPRFGPLGAPGYVQVVYDAAAEVVPDEATQAVLRMVRTLWSQRVAGDATSERLGDYSVEYARSVADDDKLWQLVTKSLREPLL